jgi:hypothetical protein
MINGPLKDILRYYYRYLLNAAIKGDCAAMQINKMIETKFLSIM